MELWSICVLLKEAARGFAISQTRASPGLDLIITEGGLGWWIKSFC